MTSKRLLVALALVVAPALLVGAGQGARSRATSSSRSANEWPTYTGDYSGKRYSALTQINQPTVKNLTLAWIAKLTGGSVSGPGGRRRRRRRPRWRRAT